MFARVTTVQCQIDKVDDVIKIMEEDVKPAAQSQKGFCALYGLTDRKTGKAMAISMWDTEEDAIANEQSGYYQEQVAKLAPYFSGTPVREGYEVTSQG